ncbi:Translocation protein SEC63-like protein [Heterocephalus glaber]|uniref:Translocation protein SEC63-like protein n=1 Tax=Heterocephalus glaber TaxID=10181 RepID=G5C288_HETGA|nr:Translocation protein SEC63-like protein [Heterocephalus glaber]
MKSPEKIGKNLEIQMGLKGSWWYRSIRYSGDQILIRTTQIYTYFVYKTRNMDMKRLIMVLAGASEFDPQYNKDATSRPTDNILIPQLIREIGSINLKKNEPPLTCPYSLKARVLLLSHLARMKIPETLEEVLDDEDSNNITVGSLVTVLVKLTRQTMAEAAVKEDEEEVSDKGSDSEEEETNKDSQSEKDDGSDRESDREQDEKQNKDDEAVELKFPAPGKPGNYQYTVFLRSDSYMGLDQIKPLKLEVHEAKPVPENHPQWDTAIEGDEDQEDSEGFEDSFEEEEEEEEDDD